MDESGPDKRLAWIGARVCTTLRVKEDVWKAISNSESKKDIEVFINKDNAMRLIIYAENGRDYVAAMHPPIKYKKKAMFFLKREPCVLTNDNLHDQVIYGDSTETPLESLSTITKHVFMPLLTCPDNQDGWPDFLTKEVSECLHKFTASVFVAIGQMQGKTTLPLPADIDKLDATELVAAEDHDRIHILESCVVTWTKQIKTVLKSDPDEPLKLGQHPGPETELNFWTERTTNLNSIQQQLESSQVQKVVYVLQHAQSTYYPAYLRLADEVAKAQTLANDNVKFLAPLKPRLEKLLYRDEFNEITGLFKPVFHTLMLIWKHSGYYAQPTRIVTLMREICNSLIEKAMSAGEGLHQKEPQEAVETLRTILQVLGTFKSFYFEYKARLSEEAPERHWKVQTGALFGRLDEFLERVHAVLDINLTSLQFSKLGGDRGIEIGGTKGKLLSQSVRDIYDEFVATMEKWQHIEYNIVDVGAADAFSADYTRFMSVMRELERRLCQVVLAAFDDCATMSATFKLLDSFEGLLERDVIAQALEEKQLQLLMTYSQDLSTVKDAFHYNKQAPILTKNAALHSGSIKWVRGLRERIDTPMDKIRALNKLVLDTEEARRMFEDHAALSKAMNEFEEEHVKEWVGQVSQISNEKLALKLLRLSMQDTSDLHLVEVNFDPALINLLRETKYFLSLGIEVPSEARGVFDRSKIFRRHIGSLELIVAVWNRIQKTILPVELPLVKLQIEELWARLDEGLHSLDWNSPTIDKYLDEVKVMIDKVDDILRELKRNVDGTRKVLSQWQENLLFERKPDRTYAFADLRDEFDKSVSSRHAVIADNGKAIGKNVSSSYRTLVVRPEPADWKAYTDYVSNIVIDGFAQGIVASLNYLTGQLMAPDKPESETPPLLEVQMMLQDAQICWKPDLGDGDDDGPGVLRMFRQWAKRYLATGDLMKRLDVGEGTYGREIEEDYDVMFAFSELQVSVIHNAERCEAFGAEFAVYEDLWKKDMRTSLEAWLEEKTTTNEETGAVVPPTLKQFDEEIQRYKAMEKAMKGLRTTRDIGWTRVDAKPLKKSLESLVAKWSYLYVKFLQDKVVNEMEELYTFMGSANSVLEQRVGDEGADAEMEGEDAEPEELPEGVDPAELRKEKEKEARKNLYAIMGAMRDIRVRDERTQQMFQPLKETVALLKGYNVPVRDETVSQLDDGPMKWKALDKKKKQRIEALNSKVIAEQLEVRRRSDAFQKNVDSFAEHFQGTAPFNVKNGELTLDQVQPAYAIIDAFHHKKVPGFDIEGFDNLMVIARDAKQLQEEQDLFDLNVSSYLKLQRCGEQLSYLKSCWDMVGTVMYTFTDWYKTPWDKIDVEFLSEETKKLQKDIKSLNKAVRNYEVYRLMEEKLKAMSTSLPLVGDLAHPAMRDRHWEQLMRATGKTFVKDDKFSLGDLLGLGLHNYVDDCSEIVDRAQKELNIEKQLEKIESTWSQLYLSFSQYQDTDVSQMNADDAITEALEADNLTLQNMSGGKYVQGNEKFKQMVNDWQTKLGTVESVLTCWGDVQKKWQALESIFIGSADIRVQLPEDSKRFDAINADFQDLMRSAPDVTGVVEACNLEGRDERLNNLLSQLEMCEKALQDYLETKRIAFPRFYFVAPADLLDILSKGSNPQLILRHLSKCFDSVCNMEFRMNDKGEPTKAALAMFDPKGEKVMFDGECLCDGPVEQWLNSVVDVMKQALFAEYQRAIPAYDNMKRSSEWIYEFSAQNTIVVSRTFFTQEVNEAFEELEDGNEDALKVEWEKQKSQLADLVVEINKPLKSLDRATLITLCTIDVHARDVLGRLIDERVEDVTCFQWQSQLRYVVHEKTKKCQVNICDAEIAYNYEYIGNCGCLCITPLTDRCYITLTQAQRLVLGGAPAGPAGTGKTESTKDLARALGVQCYVFNCSDQMDYKAMGQIYKGLAQTGAWGCFDEFNRIPVAVLSVCSTQYKTVLDAIRARKEIFLFEDVEIKLLPTVMAFITMNPGYPGRAELPESLKALFRPVSMVLPDLALICEIMLMAEGFQMSKLLSRKFVILYKLCEDLLSKSRHYDWKLRAIKTTLYVAGGMKRDAPELTEDKVLLRALRDFNLGKLTSDDTSIFLGLLNDLFPRTLELVPRAVDREFEAQCRASARELKYQPDDMFCLKISQLREIFVVRWSVFLLGPAGCGKTAIWKTLRHAQMEMGEKTVFKPINPKAVTRNELYGYLHPSTREWKEGLMSVTFRNFANDSVPKHQWIVLDGDIDAEWIESMNTVMDDNKMLTLASNERIPLTGSMRLLLEINHMNHCSPATVSRGGVIFVNAEDVGWRPAVDSWMDGLEVTEYKPLLAALFDKYADPCMEYCRRNFKYVVQLPAIAQAQIVCKILDGILPKEQVRNAPPPDKKKLEHDFVFACVWAFGGAMFQDKVSDYRKQFSLWWQGEWKSVPFPEKGLVYDYYVHTDDEGNVSMAPWEDIVDPFTYSPEESFGNMFVNTVETTRMKYFLRSFVANRHYCMFVGNTGTSKTAIMMNMLRNMDPETMTSYVINMNSFSDAPSLQPTIEAPLEKKSGVRFGPPGAKSLVYFVDDMNMPFVDKYDTQSAIEIMRQYVDYGGWYDKVKIVLKDIVNCQLMGAMNPTAGSFQITPRMQRHFVTFGIVMPGPEIVRSIYYQMIQGHLSQFEPDVARMAGKLTDATIELHKTVMNNFLPSSVKFHYQFNLREMSNITQGLLRMSKDCFKGTTKVVRLWLHECERVFRDRMVSDSDIEKYQEFVSAALKTAFKEEPLDQVTASPNLFSSFMDFTADDTPIYNQVASYDALKKILEEKLAEYNDSNAVMNLVLFQQAMEHICRIARIIALPCGNAMLVGVGGSGKQSLARLASFICGYDVFQIAVSSTYGVADFKENLLQLYTKAGMKSQPVTFLMTDNQIVNEKFLVFMNDLLSTGLVADLCSPEDVENFSNSVRNEVKAAGIMETPENLWDFFIEKIRKNLHVVLCFSPVGDKFRVRARQFPALVNCTVFDWFHGWPHEALVSVAQRFLVEIPDIEDEVRDNIAGHMAFVHTEVTTASVQYLAAIRRYSYTTPKSYLELISLYKTLLARKRENLAAAKERLVSGVEKIAQASAQVEDLQKNLVEEQKIVAEKKEKTGALIEAIGKEKVQVDAAVEAGREDEEAAAGIKAEVEAFQEECAKDLEAAEPVIAEAEAALNSLDKASLGELKSFGSPAAEVVQVVSACMVLTASAGKIPKDVSWNAGKKSMGNVDAFLKSLLNFDKDNIPEKCVETVEKDYLSNPNFNPDYIRSKSGAAAGLCGWVVNICKYFRIYQVVAPKRAMLADANAKLAGAEKKLTGIRAKVADLRAKVEALESNLMKATEDKNNAVAQAEKTETKAKLADRLINGLSGENKRWNETISIFDVQAGKLVGDVLLAASFVSYCGPFNMAFRVDLTQEKWLKDLTDRKIPMTEGTMPLDQLTSDTEKAQWGNEGLPTDPLSVENGAIMMSSSRTTLMIDPQLQGIRWIMNREEANGLTIIQQSQKGYIDKVIQCIENGKPLLIENLPDDIDAVLDPVVGKMTMKRGQNLVVKIGDSEVDYDRNFRLYLQTKLSNPHYKPEIHAQTTLVNFCVTEKGLEDQLLAQVVEHERPDLQEQAQALVKQLGEFTITLKNLEDNLLTRLANSQGDILEDIALIENLEETKRTALDIEEKVRLAKDTEVKISSAREVYRPVATRGSLLYFLIDNINTLDRVYHYSMANFVYILCKGMDVTPGGPDQSKVPEDQRLEEEVPLEARVKLLIDTTSYEIFQYVAQGLFERHKLIVATQLCMAILRQQGKLNAAKLEFLLKGPRAQGTENPLKEFVPDAVWACVMALRELEDYTTLPDDLQGSAKRWREWMELERPEDEPLPGDWKRMSDFDQLLLFRALRPDRLTSAMARFVCTVIDPKFTQSVPFDLERSYADARSHVPIFVFLSPGVDVAAAVEALGRKLGYTADSGKYVSVSLGQGQEPIAMNHLNNFHRNGGWVLLQNIHLTIDWTSGPLEKKVDKLSEGAHPDFRLFLSGEPPPGLERPLPISLLQNSIKLTNEPPEGLQANLIRSWNNFNEEILEGCAKQGEFRTIVFGLCYFHACLLERKKFGVGNLPGSTSGIGWNMNYPFNTGDLLCCGQTAHNYLENNVKVPWDDLVYMFGEIMYGGHIVEDWDRRLANAYLFKYFNEALLEGIEYFPGFVAPSNTSSHKQVTEYLMDMPGETPLAFGLHPNAEIGFKLREGDAFCNSLILMQPQDSAGEGGASEEEKARTVLEDIVERLPETYDMEDIRGRVEDFTPYTMVAIQEAERMNVLTAEMKRSLAELDLGLRGDLTMSEPMEKLMRALAADTVPMSWRNLAYPSLRPLGSWLANVQTRAQQLNEWTADLSVPKVVWLSGLFNPQSFLTAVMQTTARRNDWPLDKTVIVTEVTKKLPDQVEQPSRDGAFIHGLTLEGARWDDKAGVLDDSKPKELFYLMPVILVKAVTVDRAEMKDAYQCPVYATEARFREEIFTAQLKSKASWIKWTLAGVCMFLDVV